MSGQSRTKLPEVVFVVARSEPGGVIGAGNAIPWHLKTDMKRFKAITLGHAVIMGRKTFASIGRPLSQRMNIVLSSRGLGMGSPNLMVQRSKDSALAAADNYALSHQQNAVFVIGGAEVFQLFEPLCQRVHLTEVLHDGIAGDTYFDRTFDPKEWKTVDQVQTKASVEDDYPTRYLLLERRLVRERFRDAKNEATIRAV